MRQAFKKNIGEIEKEEAHGGSGARQLLLSKADPVSSQFEAMTKGFLAPGAVFDWHEHNQVDEFFLVLKGTGSISFKDGTTCAYRPDDLVYIPANLSHRIENTGCEENEFFFVRLNS